MKQEKQTAKQKRTVLSEVLEDGLTALILALIIITYVVRPFMIPSGSMIPTLQIGDRIFVNRFIYRFHEPQRGDVAVFVYDKEAGKKRDFIKRIIATEGEIVEIKDGHIYVNDELVTNNNFIYQNRYYQVKHAPYGSGKIEVPPGHLFVLGDNSGNSNDSRFWGFVPVGNLKGKAFFIFWPLGRIQLIH